MPVALHPHHRPSQKPTPHKPSTHTSTSTLVDGSSDAYLDDPAQDDSTLLHPDESYLVKDLTRTVPSSTSRTWGKLYPGSEFRGVQKSGRVDYEVEIALKDVNFDEWTVCGYLTIKGLTDEYPELTTFFDGEIIGPKYHFVTGKWNADADIDFQHWNKFPDFAPAIPHFNTPTLPPFPTTTTTSTSNSTTATTPQPTVLFMRWKEKFLVPDHLKRDISGASFAGFYYIKYEVGTGATEGYYFHESSEWFQKLTLSHIPDKGFPAFEFR